MSFFGKIGKIWSFVKSLLAKPPKPITPSAPIVVSVYLIKEADGKQYRVTKYNDGTMKKEPYDENDPTGVGGFLDGIRR